MGIKLKKREVVNDEINLLEKIKAGISDKKELLKAVGIAGCLLLMALINAYSYGAYADFSPLNGDFQNFNPVRRFLNGQTPFVDFEVYLGMGHLWTGSIFTFLLGGDFQASLYAMRMLTFLAFEITVLAISYSVFGKKSVAAAFTIFVSALNLIAFGEILPVKIGALLSDSFNGALSVTRIPGNSARLIRSSICAIAPVMAFITIRQIYKWKLNLNNEWIRNHIAVLCVWWVGVVAGLSIFWSNDYGISSAASIIFICGIICLKEAISRGKISSLLWDSLSVMAGFLFAAGVGAVWITHGHPLQYLSTTLQVSEYQSWYAVHSAEGKAYYLWDIPIFEPAIAVAAILCITYFNGLLRKKVSFETIRRYGIPACMLLTSLFATHLYRVSDGGGAEYFWIVFSIVIITEALKFFMNLLQGRKYDTFRRKIKLSVYIISLACFTAQAGRIAIASIGRQLTGTYVEELGGNVNELGAAVVSTRDKLGTSRVFNTYASAVEAVTNQFQPSGTDYIIHALGDRKRIEYLSAFRDADYVGTIRDDYAAWEWYIRGENWWFYREFLNDYVISFANSYQNYYSKADNTQKEEVEGRFDIQRLSDDTVSIKLYVGDVTYNGLADVFMDYKIWAKSTSIRDRFCYRTLGHITDINYPAGQEIYCDISLPGGDEEVYFPIVIRNGVGEIKLTSYPRMYSCIDIENIFCEGFYQNALDIVQVLAYSQNESQDVVLTVPGNWADTSQKVIGVQHENLTDKVLECSSDGSTTTFILERNDEFFHSLDEMSAVKLLTREKRIV